jgi:prefoldin subunit 5
MLNRTFTDHQIVNATYTIIYKMGVYYDDCDDWLDLPAAEQTWANFQTQFTAAHRKAKRKQRTTQLEGYHGANAALQIDTALQSENEATIDALTNMATAMSADRATMSQLTKSIAELTAQITAKDNEIASLKNRPRNSNSNNNNRQQQQQQHIPQQQQQ